MENYEREILYDKLGTDAHIERPYRMLRKESSSNLDDGSGKARTITAKLFNKKQRL